jgi:nucleotide-binding universal stress UspA family protein
MSNNRLVVWLTEDTWTASVDAAALASTDTTTDVVLLYVIDTRVGEAAHGAFGGLLGRGSRRRDPGTTVTELTTNAANELLADATRRLGRPARTVIRSGQIEREVVAECEGADLLICARDGDQRRLGPHSLGPAARFVVDHAPCAVLLVWPNTVPGLRSIPPPPQHPPGHQSPHHR